MGNRNQTLEESQIRNALCSVILPHVRKRQRDREQQLNLALDDGYTYANRLPPLFSYFH